MPKAVSGDNFLDAIEDLAESFGLAHPRGMGLGFDFDQVRLIDKVIMEGIRTGAYNEEDE